MFHPLDVVALDLDGLGEIKRAGGDDPFFILFLDELAGELRAILAGDEIEGVLVGNDLAGFENGLGDVADDEASGE